jgi:uncharacterized protein YbbC (DUF1343 family)
MLHLTGNAETVKMIEDGASAEQIVASWSKDLDAFDQMRRKYFLYK